MKKRTIQIFFHISIKVEIIRLVRVKAYKRMRFGKIERVRSYCKEPPTRSRISEVIFCWRPLLYSRVSS